MKLVKKTNSHSIYQRRDGRYAVKDAKSQNINGEDKVRILVSEGLLKAALPKAEEPAETAAEEASEGEESAAE